MFDEAEFSESWPGQLPAAERALATNLWTLAPKRRGPGSILRQLLAEGDENDEMLKMLKLKRENV